MTVIISIDSLTKQYGDKIVLNGISFTIEQGEIFALIGTNGAGKTTALECIEGLRKYSGTIEVHGKMGVQLQSTSLPGNIKIKEALKLFAKWNGTTLDTGLIQRLNLEPMMNKKYNELSTGQKRRLHLVLAMVGEPDIVFLDEPTAGLDVEGRVALHEEIRALKQRGKTIVLTSHDMVEVEELCDRLAILKNGQIGFIGTVYELTETKNDTYTMSLKLANTINSNALFACTYIGEQQGYQLFETKNLEEGLYELTSVVRAEKNTIYDVKIEQTSLEKRFMDLVREEVL